MDNSLTKFIIRWYTEGLLTTPPPCLYNKTIKGYLNDNTCCGPISCVKVGRWGFSWGEKYRSQIMFYAFWCSFISFVLLMVSFASLSYDSSVIKDVSWTTGEADSLVDGIDSLKVFVGLRIIAFDCSGSLCTGDDSVRWTDTSCTADYCDECNDAASGTEGTAFFGMITMLPQMGTNLQRSTVAGDLNCQKWLGMFTSFMGLVSTLSALSTYANGCYNNLPDTILGNDISYSLGPSFYCMLFATLFKIIDIAANFIVPVPETGGWSLEGHDGFDGEGNDDDEERNNANGGGPLKTPLI